MKHDIFFIENGDVRIGGLNGKFTINQLYEAIKEKLQEELYVSIPNTGFSGKLKER